MAEPGPGAKLRDDLAKVEAAIAAQAALRGVLPEEQLAVMLEALEARRRALEVELATAEPGRSGRLGTGSPAARRSAQPPKTRSGGERKKRARVTGTGAAAQGTGAAAAGEGGFAVASGGVLTWVEGDLVQAAAATADSGASLEASYLNWLFEDLRGLSLAAVDPAVAAEEAADARLELDAVYTGLMTIGQQEPAERPGRAEGRPAMRESGEIDPGGRPVSALARLDGDRRLVLLGDPGSGKTTFVSFVALCLAGERLRREDANLDLLRAPLAEDEEEPQPWQHGPLLPVRVVLRDFAARGLPAAGKRASASHLWSFVRSELESATLGGFAETLERKLRNDGGLILLDGLDEVAEAEERRVQIRQAVEDFARAFGRCRMLVTSRTYAYRRQDWHLSGFAEAVLAPFGPAQVARFVERWYGHLAAIGRYGADDARGRAALLQQRIEANDRLRTLAERPLLLTLMASLHAWHGDDLPERRERLYAAAVDLLLNLWERRQLEHGRDGRPVRAQPSLVEWLELKDKESLRVLLERLAFDAHAAQPDAMGTADVPEGALVQGLLQLGSPAGKPGLLIEYLRDRAGLLEPRGVGVYTFPHRTFQEYLAACHLTRGEYPDEVARLARSEPDRWREVALLAGAKAASGTTSAVWSLAAELYEPAGPEPTAEDAWGAHLAAQALVEVVSPAGLASPGAANRRLLDRIRGSLAELIRGSELPARERTLAGDNLSRLGDPRPEATTVDGMQLCWVPSGPFWMGSDEDDKEGFEDEKPAGELDLPYGYLLGRFPVTAAQFGEFETAGGYAKARYWAEAAAAGVWTRSGVRGEYVSEPRCGTGLGDSPWGLPARPVVGITWYEALAFCRWLTDRWRAAGRLPAGWTASLPSEAEWEKAARGGLELPRTPELRQADEGFAAGESVEEPNESPRRRYPWAGAFDPERASAGPTGIGSTSAVGCFPGGRSPYGVEELSGNCWEWTRSARGDYPYPAAGGERAEREKLESQDPRVLRGGSYSLDPGRVRCAYRYRGHPGYRFGYFGFRVVVLPPVLL